jgi:predicted RNA-binding protein with PUA domain
MNILGILRFTDNNWEWEPEPLAEEAVETPKITEVHPKNNQQVVDLALRVDENGNVLPQRVIKPETVQEEE